MLHVPWKSLEFGPCSKLGEGHHSMRIMTSQLAATKASKYLRPFCMCIGTYWVPRRLEW